MGVETERTAAGAPRPSGRKYTRPEYLQVKTYVILQRVFSASRDVPNVRVLDVKLNLGAAEAVRDQHTGTWIVRVWADKRHELTTHEEPV